MKALIITAAAVVATSLRLGAGCVPDAPAQAVAFTPVCPPGQVCIQEIRRVVQWINVAKTEKSYTVERGFTQADGTIAWSVAVVLPRNSTTWTDYAPAQWYRVSACSSCGCGSAIAVNEP